MTSGAENMQIISTQPNIFFVIGIHTWNIAGVLFKGALRIEKHIYLKNSLNK